MLIHILDILLTLLAVTLLIPSAVFSLQCLAALLPLRRHALDFAANRPSVGIIMPAHNEEAAIAAAIASIQPQLRPGDRLLVVADNCTDRTAWIAQSAGAEVVVRTDADHRGKGFALDFGLTHLSDTRPQVIIICDSDCEVCPGMIDALVQQVQETGQPAQAVYLMTPPIDPQPRDTISAFAFMVKNLVRPNGLARLGLPCMLTGTGMAFPWDLLRSARLASGNIVEDLQLGIELALKGHAPRLCPAARVYGQLPSQGRGARTQRTRWEHGFLQTAIRNVPVLLKQGIIQMNRHLFSMGLDLLVPPLALLVSILLAATAFSLVAVLAGVSWLPALVSAASLAAVGLCVLAAWAKFGRNSFPFSVLASCPLYVVAKLPIYLNFIRRRETNWIRTARADEADDEDEPLAKESPERLPTILLNNVRFHAITESQCIDRILAESNAGRGGMVVTPNLDHLQRCRVDANYAGLIAEADIVVADGMPLVWASKLQGTPLPERVAGSDLISSLSEAANVQGRSVFLLGGNPGAADRSAAILIERYPGLKVVGTHCPPMGFELNPEALTEIIDKLSETRPDIVFVGLGSPKQEKLIHELREWLPAGWWLGVGYSFSFLAGEGKRAPLWMRQIGMEWLHRLASEPTRLARRYLVDGLPFALKLLLNSAASGLTGSARREAAARPMLETAEPRRVPTRPGVGLTSSQVASLVHQSLGVAAGSFAAGGLAAGEVAAGLGAAAARGAINDRTRPARLSSIPRSTSFPRLAQSRSLRAFVLLDGSIRPTPFRSAIKRSLLDLPIAEGQRLLLCWQQQVAGLATSYGLDQLPLRVQVNHDSLLPAAARPIDGCGVSIERDQNAYRGTGGTLHDIAEDYDDNDLLLVANGGQVLTRSLVDLTHQLHELEADVSFVAHEDGTPSGLMMVRCKTLRAIASKGYVDMKEQALPAIARRFRVAHLDQRRATGLPLHTFKDYLAAVRWWHRHGRSEATLGADAIHSAQARVWEMQASFNIVESGATVAPGAYLHDSVVLRGSIVGAGAVVARSVLCAGSLLEENETAVDELLTGRASTKAPTRRVLQTA